MIWDCFVLDADGRSTRWLDAILSRLQGATFAQPTNDNHKEACGA